MAQEIKPEGISLAEKALPSLEKYKRLEQLVEVVAIVGLACSLGVIWLNANLLWLIPLMILVLIACAYAIHFSYQADKCSYQAEEDSTLAFQKTTYRVTERRLRILREKGVEEDVLDIICELKLHKPMTASELLEGLETELGQERTDEVRATLLKYLRIDKQVTASPPAEDQ